MTDIKNDRRIVVGVDGSESSTLALRWAIRQAELTGAAVEAIYAWEIPTYAGMAPMVETGAEPELLAKAGEQVLADALAEVAADRQPRATVDTRVVAGHPAFALIQAAEGADLLVVGSRGHGGFMGALLGSVSQYCVHHATCPVVVIRDSHHR
ncbi:universal stress protein [Planosporangium sp. 12N6]|uniref:universal stress protein n=1 Tax=Planosporangium spinosum TaxID=3402278 RepID=UPI003CEE3911